MKEEQILAELRLFKSYTDNELPNVEEVNLPNTVSLEKGIIYDNPYVTDIVTKNAIALYGKDSEAWNATFHKSFSTVKDNPIEKLIAQQVLHYFSTYGLEALGIFDHDLVYIPNEVQDIPEFDVENIPIIVIHRIAEEQLQERLMKLLTSGIALSKETIEDIMVLSDYIPKKRFDEINNKEVRIALYDKYNIVPSNNIMFLRYFIYKLTASTLLVKNSALYETLKTIDSEIIYKYLSAYLYKGLKEKEYNEYSKPNYIKLARIALRYRKIFMCIKQKDRRKKYAKEINNAINIILRIAKKYNEPVGRNVLDCISDINTSFNWNIIERKLDNVSIFRCIRILNGLRFRLMVEDEDFNDIVYRIRNGKIFVTKIEEYNDNDFDELRDRYKCIYEYTCKRLSVLLKDKSVYIPDNINYVLPQSEKQFTQNIPDGSFVEIPKDKNVVIGIHWNNLSEDNLPNSRVDLDLHTQNRDQQFGWNTSFRSGDGSILFSGDVTDAPKPNGATEVMFISRNCEKTAFLMTLNNFTANEDKVPFDFMIATCDDDQVNLNYMVNPNNIICQVRNTIDPNDNDCNIHNITLGLCKVDEDSIKFYFSNMALGSSIITTQNDITRGVYNYLINYTNSLDNLKIILEDAGVNLVDKPEVEALEEVEINGEILYKKVTKPVDYNLSLESLTKDSFINMILE